ncbi:Asp-tRNA(Asn)/Glu-tRNA(Gln) amidotransferase GatCAB subunit A [Pseudonocardiaceae bacterium YIM PH 21723]|nr:Asp-tRNA(Asn)/Glu-tRNA(Gln) amidotransferase GatCAB subunit A [Pseudonocardiaceae bacterium YIM PH 21723]
MRPHELSLTAAAAAIAARELSPVELTESVLGRIEETEPPLNAYVTVTGDRARAEATRAEQEIAAGDHRGPLHGIPMALKDLIDVAGLPTTASSRVRAGHRAERDSVLTERLAAAGSVLLGKVHTHEFAYGLITAQTRNAVDQGRIAGGSSGGSAVAVAAGSAMFSLGTDTGGSIRVPSAFNGVVGLKPTYGLVPRHGVIPLSWSTDHVGPIARTVADAGLVLGAIAGHDPRDPGSVPGTGGDYAVDAEPDLTGLRIGVPVNYYFDRVRPEVEAAVRAAITRLESLGAHAVEVRIPQERHIAGTLWSLVAPEATAVHERTLRTDPDAYGADVRTFLEAGALIPAVDHIRGQRMRELMKRDWAELLETVDVIAAPSTPITAPPPDALTLEWPDGSTEDYTAAVVRLSAPANLTGLPALSLPVGADADGLPIGMQLLGRPLEERTLLRAGHAFELSHHRVEVTGRP